MFPSVDKSTAKVPKTLLQQLWQKVVKLSGFICCYFIENADKIKTTLAKCLRGTIFKVQLKSKSRLQNYL